MARDSVAGHRGVERSSCPGADDLRTHDLIHLEHGVYRASQITLYSSFAGPPPPMNP